MKRLPIKLSLLLLATLPLGPTVLSSAAAPIPESQFWITKSAPSVPQLTVAPPPKKPKKQAPGPRSRFQGKKLGVYKGPMEPVWKAYEAASASQKQQLLPLVNNSKMLWTGSWIKDGDIYRKTKEYIANSQAGDPNAVVQLAVFRLQPWYTSSFRGKPSPGQAASYRRWVSEQARAIGSTPAIVVLQPDMPFLMTARHYNSYTELLRFAAKKYGDLPNVTLYLEAGSGDWPAAGQGGAPRAVDFLMDAGIEHADGVALGSTHYYYADREVVRVAELVQELHRRGVKQELKGVINTSSNGNPWEFGKFQFKGIADEAPACRSPRDFSTTCVTIGIPPTTDVGNPKWGMDEATRKLALQYVDAFLWIGRPWLHMQASPFKMDKALTMVRSSPYL